MKDDGSDTLAMPSTSATTARPFPTPINKISKKRRGTVKATQLFFKMKLSGLLKVFPAMPLLFAKLFPILLAQFVGMRIAKEYLPPHPDQTLALFAIGAAIGVFVAIPTVIIWHNWMDEIVRLSNQEE